jgi:hypothetical protein
MNDPSIDKLRDENGRHEDSLYERDFVLWLDEQVALLRAKQFALLDLPNLVEEIEGIARSDRRELRSRLEVLLTHLLKWQYQPEKTSSTWLGTIREQRSGISKLTDDSTSLAQQVPTIAARAYKDAMAAAAADTGVPEAAFPLENPFTEVQILDRHFPPISTQRTANEKARNRLIARKHRTRGKPAKQT